MARHKPDPQVEILDEPRAFAQFLSEIEDGALHHHLSLELQRLLAGLRHHAEQRGGKPPVGRLTIALDVAYEHDTALVTVRPTVNVKVPKPPRGRSVFWLDEGANLSRTNPRQASLPLRDVSGHPAGDVRSAT